jgi:hypothetical protein
MERSLKYQLIRDKLIKPNNQRKIYWLKAFLSENRKYPDEYRHEYLSSRYKNRFAPAENLRRLFVNSLNAAGGDNLNRKGKSAKQFCQLVSSLNYLEKIDFVEFLGIFKRVKTIDQLQNHLINKKPFADFGKKKVALFFRDLFILQHFPSRHRIFSNFQTAKQHLVIPIDVVICTVLNKYFLLQGRYSLEASRDFDFVNELATQIFGEDYMLLEDLWYWGYFTLHKNGKARTLTFNEAKFYTDLYFAPSADVRKRFEQFIKLIGARSAHRV